MKQAERTTHQSKDFRSDEADAMWIVKPASGSNGRGITVHHDIKTVYEASIGGRFVVMKYIAAIAPGKFDATMKPLGTARA